MPTIEQLHKELDALPDQMRGTVAGYRVVRSGNHYQATHTDGAHTSWWKAGTLASILYQWKRIAYTLEG